MRREQERSERRNADPSRTTPQAETRNDRERFDAPFACQSRHLRLPACCPPSVLPKATETSSTTRSAVRPRTAVLFLIISYYFDEKRDDLLWIHGARVVDKGACEKVLGVGRRLCLTFPFFFPFSKASRVSLSARLYLRFLVDAVDDDASWKINVH